MKHKITPELLNTLDSSIQQYVDIFSEKHDLEFEFWVADQTGTVASFGFEYYFSFEDIRLDLEQDVPKGLFLEWYDLNVDTPNCVNYRSFLMCKSCVLTK